MSTILRRVMATTPKQVKVFGVSKELIKARIEAEKRMKSKPSDIRKNDGVSKSNEISWANHFKSVAEAKTRQTSKGIEIRIGNMIIIVKDPAKVESVKKRFEEHERNKFKNL